MKLKVITGIQISSIKTHYGAHSYFDCEFENHNLIWLADY